MYMVLCVYNRLYGRRDVGTQPAPTGTDREVARLRKADTIGKWLKHLQTFNSAFTEPDQNVHKIRIPTIPGTDQNIVELQESPNLAYLFTDSCQYASWQDDHKAVKIFVHNISQEGSTYNFIGSFNSMVYPNGSKLSDSYLICWIPIEELCTWTETSKNWLICINSRTSINTNEI